MLVPIDELHSSPHPACRVAAHLAEGGVSVKEYSALLGDVRAMAAAGTKLWMDPSRVHGWAGGCRWVTGAGCLLCAIFGAGVW